MTIKVQRLLNGYSRLLSLGGLVLLGGVLAVDSRWMDSPVSTAVLMFSIFALRAVPVRLSKYSYLPQSAIPTLGGAVCIDSSSVAPARWVGVASADAFESRKGPRAGMINAGREVMCFVAAYG